MKSIELPPDRARIYRPLVLGTVLAAAFGAGVWVLFGDGGSILAQFGPSRGDRDAPVRSPLKLEDIPFDGKRAYEYLKQLCAIGPRVAGSPGMVKQQELLAEHFRKLGG